MPTHQSLSGASDDDLLQRMVATHPERFGEPFWAFFDASVAPSIPPRPVMLDLGCGPGLFLRDLGARYPESSLHGYDVTPAMIAYGRDLECPGARPAMTLLDAGTEPLPHAAGSVDLVSMSSVLHVLDEPLPVLAEVRRVLAPGGIFLLNDWIRQTLEAYLTWRRDIMGETDIGRGFRLFPAHNKYTTEDWHWLLATSGFAIRHQVSLRASHTIFVATGAG